MTEASGKTKKVRQFGEWEFDDNDNSLTHKHSQRTERLEPRVGSLLTCLLDADHEVVSKNVLMDFLWPNVVVGEDTLAKTVSRLRTALGESASEPMLIETVPKVGYRLVRVQSHTDSPIRPANIAILVGVGLGLILLLLLWGMLPFENSTNGVAEKLKRADGLYMKFDEQSNEAALALYQDVLNVEGDNAHAQAGIANAMVQRVVRWPENTNDTSDSRPSMTSALASGQLETPEARLMLERARLMAEKAVRESPRSTDALKSLGFVYSAEGKLSRAIEQYERAIAIDPKAWRSMVNLGELFILSHQSEAALDMFTRAYTAMQDRYDSEPQHIGPWQPALGVIIAQLHQQAGDQESALRWAERVLELEPFERKASAIYVSAAIAQRRFSDAEKFCDSYAAKLEPLVICDTI